MNFLTEIDKIVGEATGSSELTVKKSWKNSFKDPEVSELTYFLFVYSGKN